MGNEAERRFSERVPLSLKVEYADAAGLVHDYTANISRGGTFILTARNLEPGTPLTLSFSFPGLLQPLTLPGTVRWRRASPPEAQGVGVEFDTSVPETREKIESIMSGVIRGDPTFVAHTVRVLVVEDNPHVTTLIREGLTSGSRREFGGRVHFEFETVKDGREALEVLSREQFDMLLIDVYMPVMDGPSVIREVRAREGTKHLPIIALSAGGPTARAAAIAAGADYFIAKPMRLADILATMRKLAGI